MTAPKISWTLSGMNVSVQDWSCNSVANGGFDQMSGTITYEEYRRIPVPPTQGAEIIAYLPSGAVMWAGRLTAPAVPESGYVQLAAQGYKVVLERQTARRFYQSRDYSLLSAINDTPMAQNVIDDIDAIIRNAGVQLVANAGLTYASGNKNGVLLHLPDCSITKVRFEAARPRSTATWEIVVQTFDGTTPPGATFVTDTTVTLVTAAGWSGAPGTITINTGTMASPNNAMRIFLQANGASTPGNPVIVRITDLRIHGLTSTDSLTVEGVLEGLGAHADVAFNTDGVSSTLSLNPLPLDWEGTWDDLCGYVCMLEDATWRVLEPDSDGEPRLEAFKWSDARNWNVSRSTGAGMDLTPLELFNKVTVSYPSQNGSTRQVTVTASPDPLSVSGIVNSYYEQMEDVQPNSTLATTVATSLASRLSAQRYAGTIDVVSARDSTGRDSAWEMKGGDVVTVEDWGPGARQEMRVMEVSYGPDSVSLGVEQEVSAAGMIARAGKVPARKRR